MDVSDQVIKVLNELSKKIGISIDWTQQNVLPQIRDFMHRYVLYETYTSIMWLIISVLLIIITIIFIKKSIKYSRKEDYDDEVLVVLSIIGIILIIVSIIGFITIIFQIEDIIKINTVPEVYFIDYIQSLLNQK